MRASYAVISYSNQYCSITSLFKMHPIWNAFTRDFQHNQIHQPDTYHQHVMNTLSRKSIRTFLKLYEHLTRKKAELCFFFNKTIYTPPSKLKIKTKTQMKMKARHIENSFSILHFIVKRELLS